MTLLSNPYRWQPQRRPQASIHAPAWGAPFPAKMDHSHPLKTVDLDPNVSASDNQPKNWVKPVGSATDAQGKVDPTLAAFGEKDYYARVDHVHPVAVAQDTTPIGLKGADIANDTPPDTTLDNALQDPSIIGGLQTKWRRGDIDPVTGKPKGFKISIGTTAIKNGTAVSYWLPFAELRFDENGCAVKCETEKHWVRLR